MQDFRRKSYGAFDYAQRHNLLNQYVWIKDNKFVDGDISLF